MRAIRWPDAEKICTPSPELDQTFPSASQRMPSGTPLSRVANTRPLNGAEVLTAYARISGGLAEFATYSVDSSGDRQRPFGLGMSVTMAVVLFLTGSSRYT